MIKKFAAMLLTGVMAISLAACGGSSGATTSTDSAAAEPAAEETAAAETPAATDDDTEFVVGFDAEYPPYGYLDEATGDYTGFDLELAEELCKRRGWTLKKQPINWDNKDAEIDSGTIDCIWNGMTYTGREAAYTWSKPYVNNSIVIAVLAESDIQTPADLAGKVVIVQSDSSAAVAVDIGVARYQMRNNPDTFRILEEPISTEQYAIAFKLGNEALRDKVQETYDEMLADGTVMKIAEKYSDDNLPDMLITE